MKKRFAQHFLTDRSTLRRIVEFARIEPADTVLEVGSGPGNLTAELAAVARRVIAIEIDRELIPVLRARMPANVDIIEGDALAVEWPRDTVRVVGNLPYNVATPLIKRFIENRARIRDITIMVQKEVAERMAAPPATREYGPLSVLIQYYATVTYGFTVSPGAFKPQPKVDSAVIRLAWKPDVAEARTFTDFVQRAFASRRKKLINNLLAMFPSLDRQDVARRLAGAGIDADSRPEQLSVTEFLRVYNQFPLSSGQ